MSRKRVTMQDIADACDLSRNTVSKIFNGRGTVPEVTRRKVFDKARELGYSQLPQRRTQADSDSLHTIALLTSSTPLSHTFGSYFVSAFTDVMSRTGNTLKIFEISKEELAKKQLPPHLHLEQTDGILCIEMFDRAYLELLCSLGIPLITVDAFSGAFEAVARCDFISMENMASSIALTRRFSEAGARTFGFVGDIRHCNSFYERYLGFKLALMQMSYVLDPEVCLLAPDEEPYGDPLWVEQKLRAMPYLPEAFLCANDYLALHLMTALKAMGYSVPDDVMVAGFDGSPESAVMTPGLTTAHIPSAEIGRTAAFMLLDRIADNKNAFRRVYISTTPIWRASTR